MICRRQEVKRINAPDNALMSIGCYPIAENVTTPSKKRLRAEVGEPSGVAERVREFAGGSNGEPLCGYVTGQ